MKLFDDPLFPAFADRVPEVLKDNVLGVVPSAT